MMEAGLFDFNNNANILSPRWAGGFGMPGF